MTTEANAEQLAIALMSEARKMYGWAGTVGADEHGFRAMGDRLAQWATDVRALGVAWETTLRNYRSEKESLRDDLAVCNGEYGKLQEKLAAVRDIANDLEGGPAGDALLAVLDGE